MKKAIHFVGGTCLQRIANQKKYGKQYKRLPRRLPAGKFPVAGSDRLSGKSVQPWNLRKP
ncbi:MAG: hypothetical protein ACLR8P_02675 [Clostridium fessum]